MGYREIYEKWCTDPFFSEETKQELKALEGNEAEIQDRFYCPLTFGTGGLRGILGAGINRMNIYTVRQATQGLANYILSMNGQEKGVAIAYDSRQMSPEFAQVAAYEKKQGKTLWDAILELYHKYGFYKEGLASLTLKGIDGAKQIQERIRLMRENPPKALGGHRVLAIRDYQADRRENMQTGEVTKTGLPASNVLYYELEDNAWCCVRPSGTEPKIKYYFGVKGDSLADAETKLERLKKDLLKE